MAKRAQIPAKIFFFANPFSDATKPCLSSILLQEQPKGCSRMNSIILCHMHQLSLPCPLAVSLIATV